MSVALMQAVGRIWTPNLAKHRSSDVVGALVCLPSRQVCAPVLMGVGGTNAASTELVAVTGHSQSHRKPGWVREDLVRSHTYRTYLEALPWGQACNLSSLCPPDLPETHGQRQTQALREGL